MSLNVVSFFRPAPRSHDWSNQELAEFYRVEASLGRAGISVETGRGRSDEGDPWFVFCRANSDEVIVHFARFDGSYVVASPAFDSCARGRDFHALIEALLDSHPLVISKGNGGGKLFIHPAALLVALVTTCFFKLGQTDAVAGELKSNLVSSGSGAVKASGSDSGSQAIILDDRAAATVLAAVAVAVAWSQSDNVNLWLHDATPTIEGAVAPQDSLAFVLAAPANIPDGSQSAQPPSHTFVDLSSTVNADTAPLFLSPIKHTVGVVIDHLLTSQKVTNVDLAQDFVSNESPTFKSPNLFHAVAPVQFVASNPSAQTSTQSTSAQTAEATVNTAGNGSATTSSAEQEINGLIGGSLQSHLIVNLNGAEPQFILSVKTTAFISDHSSNVVVASTTDDAAGVSNSQSSQSATSPHTESLSGAAAQPAATDIATTSAAAQPAATGVAMTSAAAQPAATGVAMTSTTSAAAAATITVIAADAAIEKFMSAIPDFQVIDLVKEMIIYDPHLTSTNLPTAFQETFTFHDGSSVVLIGLATHIAALLS